MMSSRPTRIALLTRGQTCRDCPEPPNNGMKLTGRKRHSPCREEEQRERRFRPAAYAERSPAEETGRWQHPSSS